MQRGGGEAAFGKRPGKRSQENESGGAKGIGRKVERKKRLREDSEKKERGGLTIKNLGIKKKGTKGGHFPL